MNFYIYIQIHMHVHTHTNTATYYHVAATPDQDIKYFQHSKGSLVILSSKFFFLHSIEALFKVKIKIWDNNSQLCSIHWCLEKQVWFTDILLKIQETVMKKVKSYLCSNYLCSKKNVQPLSSNTNLLNSLIRDLLEKTFRRNLYLRNIDNRNNKYQKTIISP